MIGAETLSALPRATQLRSGGVGLGGLEPDPTVLQGPGATEGP